MITVKYFAKIFCNTMFWSFIAWSVQSCATGCKDIFDAVREGDINLVCERLSCGEHVNSCDERGGTLLHWAASNGRADIAVLLLARGALIDAQDYMEMTPLHWAASGGYEDVVQVLVKQQASPDLQDGWEQTPAYVAREYGHHYLADYLEIVKRSPRAEVPKSADCIEHDSAGFSDRRVATPISTIFGSEDARLVHDFEIAHLTQPFFRSVLHYLRHAFDCFCIRASKC